jgi:ABC-type Mn2+/Zn2+ transport system ATPase subunit
MMKTPLIEFEAATLGYGRKPVLRDLNFRVYVGDYLGLVGPNGAGKTTIVRTILRTLTPLAGTVRIQAGDGGSVCFGYVPQRDTIDYVLPYTAREVVMMGRYWRIGLLRRPGKADWSIVEESLKHVEAEEFARLPFKDLSGGQKQRVLIARALAAKPDVLILDEPTNGMDLSSRLSILALIGHLHDKQHLTIIMVSHLLDDVANHVKRLAIVQEGYFLVGNVQEVLTGATLSALYEMPVEVTQLKGKTIILAGEHRGNL